MQNDERLDLKRDGDGRLLAVERVRSGGRAVSARIGPLPERLAPPADQGGTNPARAVIEALARGGAAVRAAP
jgi:hypothetical protein